MSVTNNCSNTRDIGKLDRVLEGTEVMGHVERKEKYPFHRKKSKEYMRK